MKNPERVADLLDALKAECEFQFEFDAVAALADAINELPRVTVVDDRHQKFLGKVYNQRTDNHYGASVDGKKHLLHRDVWTSYYGKIPNGFVIHHIDENPANNNIENFRCMSASEHVKLHGGRHLKGKPLPIVKKICKGCGKPFNGKTVSEYCSKECCAAAWRTRRRTEAVCEVCGRIYMRFDYSPGNVCSYACAARKGHESYRRNHPKN